MSETWKRYLKYPNPISDQEKKELEKKRKSARNAKIGTGVLSLVSGGVGSGFLVASLAASGTGWVFLSPFWAIGAAMTFLGMGAFPNVPYYIGEEKKYKQKLDAVEGLDIKDDRAPILLIRSFSDEELPVYYPGTGADGLAYGYYKSTFAEAIEITCQKFGPVITSYNPNPKIDFQVPGGKHLYLVDNWHEKIEDIMKECQLIIAILGTTTSFMWELEQVAKLGFLDKLIILLPDEPIKRWSSFLKEVRKYPNLMRLNLPTNLGSACITFSKGERLEFNNLRWDEYLTTAMGTTSAEHEAILNRVIRKKLKGNPN